MSSEEVIVEVENISKNSMEVKIRGEGHTILNMLVDELNKNPHVTASYKIDHPLLPFAHLLIQTDGTLSPIEALREATSSLKNKLEALRESLRKGTT
ncbi:MAG: RpoL/Rpb11 RNA polymerase subunit family protein [Infirmifilum sp.]|jgi:DNA-directed RNA polymerase subunit L|uniref:RpoL/Rpb11 RNA polymerase subunit family protein n=1 Tax=Infirmifilum TaxID=2856573 RepID=UPI00069CAFB4|nr:RpoL/Rpb11 RNA polymerase subunit family protein [Infirmifilum uzonense]